MKHLSALLILPLLAIACGSEPAANMEELSSARASLALGDGEEQITEEQPVVNPAEETQAQPVVGDAGAPVAPEAEQPLPTVVGDAGVPVVPVEAPVESAPSDPPVVEAAPVEDAPVVVVPPTCTEGETRCVDNSPTGTETCIGGEFVRSEDCNFVCDRGACIQCAPGGLLCYPDRWIICAEDQTIRLYTLTAPPTMCAIPADLDLMSLPIVENPDAEVRMQYSDR